MNGLFEELLPDAGKVPENENSIRDGALATTLEAGEVEYSDRERETRNRFVKEYMIDKDPLRAAIRCGFLKGVAKTYAEKFLEEPYVQRLIVESEKSAFNVDEVETDRAQKSIIMTGLFNEARFQGTGSSHSARVSALTTLAKLHGMEAKQKVSHEVEHKGGVMLIPVVATTLDSWEKTAIRDQAALIHDARN